MRAVFAVALLPLCAAFHAAVPLAPSRATVARPALTVRASAVPVPAEPAHIVVPEVPQRPALHTIARTVGVFSLSLLVPAIALASREGGGHGG